MRLIAVARGIHRLLLPGERHQFHVLVSLSLCAALLEAFGATVIFTLLSRFTSDGSTFVDGLFPSMSDDGVMALLVWATLTYALLRVTFSIVEVHLQSRRVQQFAGSLSSRILDHYARSPMVEHGERRSGEFLRNTWYSSEMLIRQSLLGVLAAVTEIAVMGGVLTVLVLMMPMLSLAVLGGVGLVVLLGYQVFGRYIVRWGAEAEDDAAACLQQVQEFFGGFREIKLATAESQFVERYRSDRMRLARSYWRYFTLSNSPRLVLEGLLAAVIAIMVLIFWRSGAEDDGIRVMALVGYVGFRVLPSANRLLVAVGNVNYGSPALDLIQPVFDGPVEEVSLRPIDGWTDPGIEIEVRQVTVTYPGAETSAVDGVSLAVSAGECVGLVGGSGDGKTTILNVIAGLIVPTQGSVLAGRQDISEHLFDWRSRIGLVAQASFLLDASVRENVAFGAESHEVDDERIWWALERARLVDHVHSLPDGLSARLGDRGAKLSGGQVQRIAIARALYKDPAVLLLDEPTAALDRGTELELVESLAEISSQYTTVLVSHRLPMLRHCDRILRLLEGRLVGPVTYKDLASEDAAGAKPVIGG